MAALSARSSVRMAASMRLRSMTGSTVAIWPVLLPMEEDPQVAFRVLMRGGPGQVGAAVVRALAAEPSCAEVVINRRAIAVSSDPRLRHVVVDTAAARFPDDATVLAQGQIAQGEPVYGASCV